MHSDIVIFNSLSDWQAKVNDLNANLRFPNARAESYSNSPMITADGKYALQVLQEARMYFNDMQLVNFDDLFQRQGEAS